MVILLRYLLLFFTIFLIIEAPKSKKKSDRKGQDDDDDEPPQKKTKQKSSQQQTTRESVNIKTFLQFYFPTTEEQQKYLTEQDQQQFLYTFGLVPKSAKKKIKQNQNKKVMDILEEELKGQKIMSQQYQTSLKYFYTGKDNVNQSPKFGLLTRLILIMMQFFSTERDCKFMLLFNLVQINLKLRWIKLLKQQLQKQYSKLLKRFPKQTTIEEIIQQLEELNQQKRQLKRQLTQDTGKNVNKIQNRLEMLENKISGKGNSKSERVRKDFLNQQSLTQVLSSMNLMLNKISQFKQRYFQCLKQEQIRKRKQYQTLLLIEQKQSNKQQQITVIFDSEQQYDNEEQLNKQITQIISIVQSEKQLQQQPKGQQPSTSATIKYHIPKQQQIRISTQQAQLIKHFPIPDSHSSQQLQFCQQNKQLMQSQINLKSTAQQQQLHSDQSQDFYPVSKQKETLVQKQQKKIQIQITDWLKTGVFDFNFDIHESEKKHKILTIEQPKLLTKQELLEKIHHLSLKQLINFVFSLQELKSYAFSPKTKSIVHLKPLFQRARFFYLLLQNKINSLCQSQILAYIQKESLSILIECTLQLQIILCKILQYFWKFINQVYLKLNQVFLERNLEKQNFQEIVHFAFVVTITKYIFLLLQYYGYQIYASMIKKILPSITLQNTMILLQNQQWMYRVNPSFLSGRQIPSKYSSENLKKRLQFQLIKGKAKVIQYSQKEEQIKLDIFKIQSFMVKMWNLYKNIKTTNQKTLQQLRIQYKQKSKIIMGLPQLRSQFQRSVFLNLFVLEKKPLFIYTQALLSFQFLIVHLAELIQRKLMIKNQQYQKQKFRLKRQMGKSLRLQNSQHKISQLAFSLLAIIKAKTQKILSK